MLILIVQILQRSSSIPADLLFFVFDWACDRIIEGRFSERPTSIFTPLFSAFDRFPRRLIPKFMLALEVTVASLGHLDGRNVQFSFLNLLISHASSFLPRADAEFAVALLQCLAKLSGDPTLESECFQLLDLVWGWLSSTKAMRGRPELLGWVRAMRECQQLFVQNCADVSRANEVLLARQTMAITALLSDVRAHGAEIQPILEQECAAVLADAQRSRTIAELEVANQRRLLALSFEFDEAAYARAREKRNLFARFAEFRMPALQNGRLREALFRMVFALAPHEWVTPVEVECSGVVGRCLLGSKDDAYYFVEDLGRDFEPVENSAEFGGTLRAVVSGSMRYEGRAVVPLMLNAVKGEVVMFSWGGNTEFRVSSADRFDPKFAGLIARARVR
jgi:hypothetical protein